MSRSTETFLEFRNALKPTELANLLKIEGHAPGISNIYADDNFVKCECGWALRDEWGEMHWTSRERALQLISEHLNQVSAFRQELGFSNEAMI